jgi:hypothetical protein
VRFVIVTALVGAGRQGFMCYDLARLCKKRTLMSRGPGTIQRRLVEILERDQKLLDTFELAARAYDLSSNDQGRITLSDPQLVAVRRALRGLVRKGAIADLGRNWHNGRKRWATVDAAARYHDRVKAVFGR